VVIRDARPDDVEALAEIQRSASLVAFARIFPPHLYAFPMDDVRDRWRAALSDPAARIVLAEIDRAPAGLACVRPEWLDGLYVVPEKWGEGIGRVLHDHALSLVEALGSTQCHLWVLEHNDRARRFYERLGWRENGEIRVVPFPPNPIDVGYTIDLESRMATP
jgi:GNAT superfamily N-acetyltransferase